MLFWQWSLREWRLSLLVLCRREKGCSHASFSSRIYISVKTVHSYSRTIFRNMQACRNPDPSSPGDDGDPVGVAGDFDVVAWSSRIKTRALQLRDVARNAEGLIVEDQRVSPALEVDAGGDTCGAAHGNL